MGMMYHNTTEGMTAGRDKAPREEKVKDGSQEAEKGW